MELFRPATTIWFRENFAEPTRVQELGWPVIARGEHALLIAPTGSGKTLAAFLWAIDRLASLPPDAPAGFRVVYVSPLKALVYDIERNLRAPLAGIQRTADKLGSSLRRLRVDVRTGDTPARERQRQARNPGEILITTPESLFLVLASQARANLTTVGTVIVDEVHALAPSKRGTHLTVSLERLAELADRDPQRIGLSATVRPTDVIAGFLGGDRPVEVVDAAAPPRLDLNVVVPVPDMVNVDVPAPEKPRGGPILGELYAREVATPPAERGIWPAIYPELLEDIKRARSTIVFVNSRGLCERLCQRLNELAGEEMLLAHHGSVSHAKRAEIEESLKAGRVRGIIATSSLELGIDMGAVDQVLLVESPGSVARGLQRVGRAGHDVGEVSIGRIYPKFRGDLLECAVVASRMLDGRIEPVRVPSNPLDVLAQQVVSMVCDTPRSVEEIERIVRRAYPYRDLSAGGLQAVLEMLSGSYPSTDFADLRARLSWDRARNRLSPRRGTAMLSRLNAGTIPDRGTYGVFLGGDGPRVGELDEEMVFETREGDRILLGATTWCVESITRDRVVVSPAPGEAGRLPFWRGQGPGRPVELGRELGAFVRQVGAMSRDEAEAFLRDNTPLGDYAAGNLAAYISEQKEHTGTLPTDRSITVERFRDELGDWRVCILTPFGSTVHAPWAVALQQLLGGNAGFEIQVMYTDDGIVLRFADTEELPPLDTLFPDPDEIEDLVTRELAGTSMFAGLFRENAVRSLLLVRRRADRRNPLWVQRLKSRELLATAQRYPSFPVVLETYREILSDVYDMEELKGLLRRVRGREIRTVDVETRSASPFARSLVFAYVAAYLYEQDSPLAERKAQALTLDRNLLGELLGQAELRELIDPDVLSQLEAEMQGLAVGRRARDADELHDLLHRLGDLTVEEIASRCEEPADAWLATLTDQRRALRVTVADERRWIAAEDAALFRDALGAMPPGGLPDRFLQPVDDPLERLLRRYARSHGPFLTREVADRFGLRPAQIEPLLRVAEQAGDLVRGELRPGGTEREWCNTEVLRRLKRRTLARLRHEVAPVDASLLGHFLPQWHGMNLVVESARPNPNRLEESISQLEGLPLPWSALSLTILPARVPGFTLTMLDMLAASGAVVWIGRGAIGPSDGRVVLYRREQAATLIPPPEADALRDPLHREILDHLESRGASFLTELRAAVERGVPGSTGEEFEAALWDLVWGGLLTNDTFAPLRGLGRRGGWRSRIRRGQPLAGGRWSLVSSLVSPGVTDTERALAYAHMLLERYGIVSREAARADEIPGGFTAVYKVLKAMEEAGRIRRGYFVEGLSGAQFAHAGAVDRLRSHRFPDSLEPYDESAVRVLAAIDPANPYGSLLPWPRSGAADEQKARRVPGAWVILVEGRLALYVGASGKQLLSFPSAVVEERGGMGPAYRALHRLPWPGRRRLVIQRLDGVPIRESTQLDTLRSCGFVSDYRGLTTSEI